MTDTVTTGLWILLAMVVIVVLVAGFAASRFSDDAPDQDLEHFDHEPGDSSAR